VSVLPVAWPHLASRAILRVAREPAKAVWEWRAGDRHIAVSCSASLSWAPPGLPGDGSGIILAGWLAGMPYRAPAVAGVSRMVKVGPDPATVESAFA
jgi:hypothetical protein